MKSFIDAACEDLSGTPQIVKDAMLRLRDKLSKPAVPVMSQCEFDALPYIEKCIMACNMPKCGKVVCTHGMLCVDHHLEMSKNKLDVKMMTIDEYQSRKEDQ